MQNVNYTITDELGIHARPAGQFVKMAQNFKSAISIKRGEKKANAKGIMGIMSLGVKQGEEIEIEINGEDETEAKEQLETFLKENL
jgi:phosphocarrier protein